MKTVTIVGARPQFIKCALVSRELRERCCEVLVHTGQHYDTAMSDVFFGQLAIPQPDYHLDVGSGSHGTQTGKMLARIEEVLLKEQPDYCLVYGDTNSTLAGALAAAKLSIPLAHVEAGLRSFNRSMPEEINRVVTDRLSDICFCPTETAVENLAREGITESVHLVGDVMFDAFRHNASVAANKSNILEQLFLAPQQYILATVHRASNSDSEENLIDILHAFQRIIQSGNTIVFPVHPRTKNRLEAITDAIPKNLRMIGPVDYLDMLQLEQNARVILTDSGGVQKEAYWSATPCVTLRDETEWPETLEGGWNVLTGAACDRIIEATCRALSMHGKQSLAFKSNAPREIANLLCSTCVRGGAVTKVPA